ncbi:hypothetical protein V6N11_003144 [Hibiscus sabdariffa]|uniref:Uncharacterized protein n=1 Tax=Hibiscus sabdariffa TaxID=183260 RepID=A0ABR2SCF9_9ROSI
MKFKTSNVVRLGGGKKHTIELLCWGAGNDFLVDSLRRNIDGACCLQNNETIAGVFLEMTKGPASLHALPLQLQLQCYVPNVVLLCNGIPTFMGYLHAESIGVSLLLIQMELSC